MSKRSSKRQRVVNLPSFGAPSDADSPPFAERNDPSSSASSTRRLPLFVVPALTTLCARIFVANFVRLRSNEALWRRISRYLKALPDPLVPKIFAMLRVSCPTYLRHEFIVTYALRGPSITLRSDLPGVNRSTISDIPRLNAGVRELELSGFEKLPDTFFASLLSHLPNLRVLILRGCTKVGAGTAGAIAKSCGGLRVVNLSHTSVTPASLLPLVTSCRSLEALKLAGIQNWTDATFANFIAGVDEDFKLTALRTLKLRQTSLSDASLAFLIALCPGLQRLDVSFTLIRHPPPLLAALEVPALQKLSLTSTAVSAGDLTGILQLLPQLRILSLGAMGASRGSRVSIGNSSAMTMNDDALRNLTTILEPFLHLEHINIVGNTKLGSTSKVNSALLGFVSRVGRKCKKLNLAGIPSLRSSDLAGLMPTDTTESSPLETLVLNNTGIDDDAGVYISTCLQLGTLEVAGTKMTSAGLFPILDACLKLENLDITSCRGVNVVDRRRFFEVWKNAT